MTVVKDQGARRSEIPKVEHVGSGRGGTGATGRRSLGLRTPKNRQLVKRVRHDRGLEIERLINVHHGDGRGSVLPIGDHARSRDNDFLRLAFRACLTSLGVRRRHN